MLLSLIVVFYARRDKLLGKPGEVEQRIEIIQDKYADAAGFKPNRAIGLTANMMSLPSGRVADKTEELQPVVAEWYRSLNPTPAQQYSAYWQNSPLKSKVALTADLLIKHSPETLAACREIQSDERALIASIKAILESLLNEQIQTQTNQP